MDILKAVINKIGTAHPVISTVTVMLLAGLVWFVLLQTFGSSPTESTSLPDQTKTPVVTNKTTGASSPIITDNHGHIDIKAQQGNSGKESTDQPK
jgi:hypothetical protein